MSVYHPVDTHGGLAVIHTMVVQILQMNNIVRVLSMLDMSSNGSEYDRSMKIIVTLSVI